MPEPPLILLIFANSRYGDGSGYLRNLPRERRGILDALAGPLRDGACRVESEQNTILTRLFDLLDRHGDALVGLHFGGHGDPEGLMFEDEAGRPVAGLTAGIAQRLRDLPRLRWIFLNGCGTAAHVDALHGLVDAPVIATETAIRDDVAADVARRFYHALGHGQTIRRAFDNTESALKAAWRRPEDVLRPEPGHGLRLLRPAAPSDRWPWVLAVRPDRPETADRGLLDVRTTLDIAALSDGVDATADEWPPPEAPRAEHRPAPPDAEHPDAVAMPDGAASVMHAVDHAVILRNARVRGTPSADAFATDDQPTSPRITPVDSTTHPFRRRPAPPTDRLPRAADAPAPAAGGTVIQPRPRRGRLRALGLAIVAGGLAWLAWFAFGGP